MNHQDLSPHLVVTLKSMFPAQTSRKSVEFSMIRRVAMSLSRPNGAPQFGGAKPRMQGSAGERNVRESSPVLYIWAIGCIQ